MIPELRQPPDPKEHFTFGAVVNEKGYVISINRRTLHVILYHKVAPDKDPEPVANGTWSVEEQDVEGGSFNPEVINEDELSELREAILQSEWMALQYEPLT